MTILNLLPRLAAFQPHIFTGRTCVGLNSSKKEHWVECIMELITMFFDLKRHD